MRGDILLGRVYGYTDRFSDLKQILLSNTFSVVPSIRYGIAQKNYGDKSRWRDIRDANPGLIGAGGEITPGSVLVIPQ